MLRLFNRAVKWHRHVNPDGSLGGEVSDEASVHKSAYVDPSAVVMAGATVGPDEHIDRGSIMLPDRRRATLS